jgi:hypothetical protein
MDLYKSLLPAVFVVILVLFTIPEGQLESLASRGIDFSTRSFGPMENRDIVEGLPNRSG